ncbi:hypothetical protein TNCV_3073901 [Trichonephila clavipes]|nr:hypothetical protein TNCV_3073901 [Trichonephila clavipes]
MWHSVHAGQFWNQEYFLPKGAIMHHRNGVVQWCYLGDNGYLTLSILMSGQNGRNIMTYYEFQDEQIMRMSSFHFILPNCVQQPSHYFWFRVQYRFSGVPSRSRGLGKNSSPTSGQPEEE